MKLNIIVLNYEKVLDLFLSSLFDFKNNDV